MVSITDVPQSVGSFGQEFNYAVWTAGTAVTLANVPWHSDYRDVVSFDSQAALDSYLDNGAGPTIALSNLTYARAGHPVRINVPFNKAYQYNYLRAHNPAQPVPGSDVPKSFYYFITDVNYIAPNTTELVVQLDVWQTFGRNVTFGNCYVERGHIGIANKNANRDNGREFLTVPEGLDIGGEYTIASTKTKTLGTTEHHGTVSFDIIIVSTVSLYASGGTVDNPILATAMGSDFQGLPNGAEMYWCKSTDEFTRIMTYLSNKPWISQGIISITAVPNVKDHALTYAEHVVDGVTFRRLYGRGHPESEIPLSGWDFRESEIMSKIPSRYRHLKKFSTFPYSLVEITTYSGSPLVLKPECVMAPILAMRMLCHYAPPSPRVAFYPAYYNAADGDLTGGADTEGGDNAEFLDMVTGITDMPTFSLVNNSYTSYLAANRNALNYQHSSADWSQQKAMTGANLAYQQANQAMDTARQQTDFANQINAQQTALSNQTAGYRALQSGTTGAISAVASGGAAGIAGAAMNAVNAGVGYAIETNHANQSLAIAQGARSGSTAIANRNAAQVADSNRSYAAFANAGDYASTIASINARVQDARLVQPTTAGQVGGDAFNLAAYRWAIHAKYKTLSSGAMHTIGEYWLRYGYAINRFTTPPKSMRAMSKFTYWKLRETYLTGSCPELFKQTIRGIFEKGVTVWSNPHDIGAVDIANNDPIDGIAL